MRDWEELRRACEQGESLAELARRYGIAYGTLQNRAVREQWAVPTEGALFPGAQQAAFGRIAGKLLRRIEDGLDGDRDLDLKEIKTLTGALKELQSLGESANAENGSGALTVRFLGEAEEMSE